jgi:crotonobetainyl-CoA:carnitine CoA-transferase CaiB-like acyl-CoA transferase
MAGSGSAHRADLSALGVVVGLDDLATKDDDALTEALTAAFATASVATWVDRLTSAGFGASPYVHDLAELMTDPWVVAHGLSVTREHGERGVITHTGPAPRLTGTPLVLGRPTPAIGDDTVELLTEIGLGDRIEALRDVTTARGGTVDAG